MFVQSPKMLALESIFGRDSRHERTFEGMFDIIDNSPAETVASCIATNQYALNQLLLKLLVIHKLNASHCAPTLQTKEMDSKQLLQSLTSTNFPENSKWVDNSKQHSEMNSHLSKRMKTIKGFKLISEESILNIFSYLMEDDIIHGGDKMHSLHLVSKEFNRLFNHMFDNVDKSEKFKHLQMKFDCGYFYTISEIYQAVQKSHMHNSSFKCDFLLPNGKVVNGTLNEYPYPLSNATSNTTNDIASKYIRFLENKGIGADNGNEHSVAITSRTLYQINGNNKNDVIMNTEKFMSNLTNNTLTTFAKYGTLSRRGLVYNKSSFNFNVLKYNTFGNQRYKLVDINLHGLNNCYIFNTNINFELSVYPIGYIARKFSQRQWIVGIIDISSPKCYLNNEICFTIDITDEIKKVNTMDNTKNLHQYLQDLKIPVYNDIPDVDVQTCRYKRYYMECYCQLDNQRIIEPFGTFTNKKEQCKIWQTKYRDDISFASGDILKLKPICRFNLDKMYSKFYFKNKISSLGLDENNNNNNNNNGNNSNEFNYALIDCQYDGYWRSGILMKQDIDTKNIESNDYLSHKQLSNYVGQVTVEMFHGMKYFLEKNNPGSVYSMVHLDDSIVAPFGTFITKEEQLNILIFMCDKRELFPNIGDGFRSQIDKIQREKDETDDQENHNAAQDRVSLMNKDCESDGKKSNRFTSLFGKKKKFNN